MDFNFKNLDLKLFKPKTVRIFLSFKRIAPIKRNYI